MDEQRDELTALTSMYEKNVSIDLEHLPFSGSIVIDVNLDKGILVGNITNTYTIEYMPPLNLLFEFPSDYPNFVPPNFKLICSWLDTNQIDIINDSLIKRFQRGSVVLYEWVNILQEDLLKILDLSIKLVVNNELLQEILFHNEKKKDEVFSSTYFECSICLNSIIGENCAQINTCKHIFCKSCLTSFLMLHINEGSVILVKCPSYKCEHDIPIYMIKNLVPPNLFERYDDFLLKTSLDLMQDITYCPRQTCNSVVIVDAELKLGTCPVCMLSFCIICKLTYHGIENCKLQSGDMKNCIEAYMGANLFEKSQLDIKYGKKLMEDLVEKYQNDLWLNKYSKKCPSCRANIEKIDGCNKMTCFKCQTHFCWLCNATVNGYSHFNDNTSKCNLRLFD